MRRCLGNEYGFIKKKVKDFVLFNKYIKYFFKWFIMFSVYRIYIVVFVLIMIYSIRFYGILRLFNGRLDFICFYSYVNEFILKI